jgi:hypothetical protein
MNKNPDGTECFCGIARDRPTELGNLIVCPYHFKIMRQVAGL